ncbi:hypothetical protein [Ruminococcus flavefaciens]|uniref:hypothetical protein n=1 Tax=Ruminococcus flavefaciens TaxID=1265 RepID=UPI0026F35B61|nr:hypothetical protein [Ruminococcus flavefaciens]
MGFTTTAWFTNNKEVSESGLQMTVGGIPFTIEFPGEDEGYWSDQYHNLSNQSGIWLVDDDKNMDNGSGTTEEKLGLEPGDSGTLEFRISPNETDKITVDYLLNNICSCDNITKGGDGDVGKEKHSRKNFFIIKSTKSTISYCCKSMVRSNTTPLLTEPEALIFL